MIEGKVYEYLNIYAEAQPGAAPDPSPDTISTLREYSEASFEVIADYSGKRPENLDPRDLSEPLGRLLSNIADLVPDLLVPRMTKGFWASRFLFICGAAASEAEVFVPTIVELLTDRSVYIKNLVLDLIAQWPHLQVPDTLPKLKKLEGMKSYQNEYGRERLEKAKAAVTQGT